MAPLVLALLAARTWRDMPVAWRVLTTQMGLLTMAVAVPEMRPATMLSIVESVPIEAVAECVTRREVMINSRAASKKK